MSDIVERKYKAESEAKIALLERITETAREMPAAEAAALYKVLIELDLAQEMAGKAAG